MLHIGNKVREVLDASNISVSDFAQRINKSRGVVYNIFTRDTIDTGLLQQISKVLNHDFFRYYTEELPMVRDDGGTYSRRSDVVENLKTELQQLKKQVSDLQKQNALLEEVDMLRKEKLNALKSDKKKKKS